MARIWQLAGLIGLGAVLATGGAEAARDDLEGRVERLERLFESGNLGDLVMQVQALQEEVQRLRGQIEVQQHRLDQLVRERRAEPARGERPSGPSPETATGEATPPPSAARPGEPVPSEAPPAAEHAAAGPEKAQYEQALGQLQERQYDQAAATLRDFLHRYPRSPYLPNVWYWLGEVSYVQGRRPEALEAFNRVRTDFPDSAKVPDALLKIGTILDEQGQPDQARDTLNELIARYPKSSAAYLAQKRLPGQAGSR